MLSDPVGAGGDVVEPAGSPLAVPLPTHDELASLVGCGLGPALLAAVRQQLQVGALTRVGSRWAEEGSRYRDSSTTLREFRGHRICRTGTQSFLCFWGTS